MNPLAAVALFVILDACGIWTAGYVLAMEDWVGGQRTRYQNWAFRGGADQVRSEDQRDIMETDQFWDRAESWPLFRKRAKTAENTPGHLLPKDANRWTYRGVPGVSTAMPGRKVPTRRLKFPFTYYAVPVVDGVPLSRADRVATILRGKLADLWGCPKCSGMWGGAILALVLSHFGPWGYGWTLVLALHVAAWGAARRLGWSE